MINKHLLKARIAPVLMQEGIRRPILWCSLPTAFDAIGCFDERAIVYYAGDDFSALSGVDHKPVARIEAQLTRKADLTIAASEEIAARLSGIGAKNIRVLHHGCDIDIFTNPAPRAEELSNAKKIAGYYGAVSDWLDWDLIEATARVAPEWTFLFIGPIQININRFRHLPNIRFIGERPHDVLPAFSQHWSVSMLPFRDTKQIRASNSLKLREYLAAGRPIVATPPTPLRGYDRLIRVAGAPLNFVTALDDSCQENSLLAARRQRSVAGGDWGEKASIVSDWLNAVCAGEMQREEERNNPRSLAVS